MIPTGKNQSTQMKACCSCTLFSTNITWTDMGSNMGIRSEGPATPSKTTEERETEGDCHHQRGEGGGEWPSVN